MNQFVNSVKTQEARTENGMRAHQGTGQEVVDFFFKVGAIRGRDPVPLFAPAFVAEEDLAVRIALWARDARSGAGERQVFRDIMLEIERMGRYDVLIPVMNKVPELGRWDDLLVFQTEKARTHAFGMIAEAIRNGNGLAAKWMPRKGNTAAALHNFMGMSPKQYRKTLVNLTNVVETKMCEKRWEEIDFNTVPSVAASRYKKAFARNSKAFVQYCQDLAEKKEGVKVNAGAVYPYEVLKGLRGYWGISNLSVSEKQHIVAQWDALPNYMGESKVLPMVDVSGSMVCPAGKETNVTCMDVAVSLGLYCADKNQGAYNGMFLTFSGSPELLSLKGDILQKHKQMVTSSWTMDTNLHAAFERILNVAVSGKVPQEDMPEILLIMSDMQFNQCTRWDDRAIDMIRRKYEAAGYQMPQVVFWNLRDAGNVPVTANEHGVALVSGFSPSILKAVLAADMEEFTPRGIMIKTVMNERYNWK